MKATPEEEARKARADSLVPRKLKVVETFRAGDRNFEVKRIGVGDWCLRDCMTNRMRFGTLAEIRDDVEKTLGAGVMPPRTGSCW
jgi:hypothetical protein